MEPPAAPAPHGRPRPDPTSGLRLLPPPASHADRSAAKTRKRLRCRFLIGCGAALQTRSPPSCCQRTGQWGGTGVGGGHPLIVAGTDAQVNNPMEKAELRRCSRTQQRNAARSGCCMLIAGLRPQTPPPRCCRAVAYLSSGFFFFLGNISPSDPKNSD